MLLTNSGWIRSLSSWAFEVPDLSVVWRRPLAACVERTGGPKDTSCLEQGRWRKPGLTTGGHWRDMDQQWTYRYLSPGRTGYSLLDQTSTEDNTWIRWLIPRPEHLYQCLPRPLSDPGLSSPSVFKQNEGESLIDWFEAFNWPHWIQEITE